MKYRTGLTDDEDTSYTAQTVHDERRVEDTGLLDQWGVPIYRVPDKVKFGFQGRAKPS